jgi:tryptophan 2,3-dioxygenase
LNANQGAQIMVESHQIPRSTNPMLNELHKPVLEGKGATDYERYLRTDELLSLQTATEDLSHPDELTFQVVHQASELLMKGASWELERARMALTEGNYPNAARLMRRANAMLEHPISLLHILETITPYDYHIIRAGLGHGSGLDSPGFLALLHVMPRIGDAFQEQLVSKGLTADDIYRRHEEFFALHDVAERMLDFDERMQVFRFHHLKLAQRIIGGGVLGTMGTPVEVLQQRMQHIAYRELWDLRNQITENANLGAKKAG